MPQQPAPPSRPQHSMGLDALSSMYLANAAAADRGMPAQGGAWPSNTGAQGYGLPPGQVLGSQLPGAQLPGGHDLVGCPADSLLAHAACQHAKQLHANQLQSSGLLSRRLCGDFGLSGMHTMLDEQSSGVAMVDVFLASPQVQLCEATGSHSACPCCLACLNVCQIGDVVQASQLLGAGLPPDALQHRALPNLPPNGRYACTQALPISLQCTVHVCAPEGALGLVEPQLTVAVLLWLC